MELIKLKPRVDVGDVVVYGSRKYLVTKAEERNDEDELSSRNWYIEMKEVDKDAQLIKKGRVIKGYQGTKPKSLGNLSVVGSA